MEHLPYFQQTINFELHIHLNLTGVAAKISETFQKMSVPFQQLSVSVCKVNIITVCEELEPS